MQFILLDGTTGTINNVTISDTGITDAGGVVQSSCDGVDLWGAKNITFTNDSISQKDWAYLSAQYHCSGITVRNEEINNNTIQGGGHTSRDLKIGTFYFGVWENTGVSPSSWSQVTLNNITAPYKFTNPQSTMSYQNQ